MAQTPRAPGSDEVIHGASACQIDEKPGCPEKRRASIVATIFKYIFMKPRNKHPSTLHAADSGQNAEALGLAAGCTLTEGAGSRVRFDQDGFAFLCHRLHPGKEGKRHQDEVDPQSCKQLGRAPPSVASCKLMLRVAPEVHAAALMAAQAQGTSLNQWAEKVLNDAAHA